jgi:hypothetical protein
MGGESSAAANDQSGNIDKGAFGFEEGSEYTMTEFKKKVDQFNKIVCLRKGLESLAEVEEYYWRVVTTGEENLTVEYVAVVHCRILSAPDLSSCTAMT